MFRKKRLMQRAATGALTAASVIACAPLISPAFAQPVTAQGAPGPQTRDSAPSHLARGQGRRSRIVGGAVAAPGQWAFMAYIAYFDASGNPVFECSGSVVAPRVVLTAGHCLVDETTGAPLDPSGFRVVTGSLDWTDASRRQVSPVSSAGVDPGYDPAIPDSPDAGLLVLSGPTAAPAIPLVKATDRYLYRAGTPALMAGWGDRFASDPMLEVHLRWARTVVQRPGYCHSRDPYFNGGSELCVVDPPRLSTGTCNGDSGGPLIAYTGGGRLVETGLVTEGPTNCNTKLADYFTSTLALSGWIAGVVQAAGGATPSQPPIFAPLPPLTLPTAKRYVLETLGGAFAHLFKPARLDTLRCARTSSARFKCAVQFASGPNDYYGTVSVYFAANPHGVVKWSDKYTIHSVNDQCYFHSGHPNRCTIHTRRGTW